MHGIGLVACRNGVRERKVICTGACRPESTWVAYSAMMHASSESEGEGEGAAAAAAWVDGWDEM